MNRFNSPLSRLHRPLVLLCALLLSLSILLLALLALDAVRQDAAGERRESLEAAVMRSSVRCYALEGRYPPSLSYLEEHYGLSYSREEFFVDYRPIAQNLPPAITVLSRKEETS